jgi:hypothetical protein
MLDRDLPSAEEAIRTEHRKVVAALARGAVARRRRARWDELSEPRMSPGTAANGGVVPLRCERSDRPAEIVIHVPDATVRTKEPRCADGPHEGHATVARCLAVYVAPLLARCGDYRTNPFRDVPRKVHVSRSNDPAFSGERPPERSEKGRSAAATPC